MWESTCFYGLFCDKRHKSLELFQPYLKKLDLTATLIFQFNVIPLYRHWEN